MSGISCQWPRPNFCIRSLPWRVNFTDPSTLITIVPAQTDSLLSAVASRIRHPLGHEAQAAARAGVSGRSRFRTLPPLGLPLIEHAEDPALAAGSVMRSGETATRLGLAYRSQNRLAEETERRADLDLHIGLLTEHELTRVLQMLDEQGSFFKGERHRLVRGTGRGNLNLVRGTGRG